MTEKILITGGAGFIGSHLIDFCINKNLEVYALDQPSASLENLIHYTNGIKKYSNEERLILFKEKIRLPINKKRLIFLECDIKNAVLLEKIIQKIKPKYIFHLAAQPYILPSWENPVDTIETNVIGTINIFEPIKKHKLKTRVLLACTSAEFGTTVSEIKRPLKEDDALLAVHPYGISKIAAELLARQYYLNFGIEIINVRFFNQTGIRRINDASSDFIRKIAQIEVGLKKPVIEVGNLNPYRDFLGINNTIQGIWLAITKGKPGEIYHICSNKKIQIRQLLNIALSFSSKEIKIIENAPKKLRKFDENIVIGDNSKIKNELGFEITEPLEKTLEDMFKYWVENYKRNIN
ncbi:MAG: GDP-mannose 4,6-dehydratase [Promethearchaeota archaeon]